MNGTKQFTEASDRVIYGRRAWRGRLKGIGQRSLDEAPVIMPERVTLKRVGIPFAESPRIPGEGHSAQGKPEPKTRPRGVVDGEQVDIPAPCSRV